MRLPSRALKSAATAPIAAADAVVLESAGMRRCLIFPAVLIAAIALTAQTTSVVEITAEPHHHLLLENEHVRVFLVDVAPHELSLLHHHGHDYVTVFLGDTTISNEVEGKPAVTVKVPDGETRFAKGGFVHAVRDLAETAFRSIAVELMQDEAAHSSPPPKWDEESGEHTFAGGTQRILFVQDGVRVSETELQAGATAPSRHYSGPHLLVAVSDMEVRSDVVGQGPMPGQFKSGEVKWLPGGYTHTLINTGKQDAKFVTLEFQPDLR